MRFQRLKLHVSVAVLAVAAMTLALTPAVADPLSGTDEYPDVAFLARNDVPFDAQTAASMAAQLGAPMFITNPNVLADAARDGIADLNPDVLIVAGGVFAISEDVANAAAAACDPDCTVDRYAGAGRDETAADLAGIADKYGFDRPVLQGSNQVVGDVNIGGTANVDDLTIQDTGLVSGLNADRLDGMHADAFLGANEKAADSELLDGMDSTEIVPLAWAQSDSSADGTSETGSGRIEVNSVSVEVPVDGVLLVSGTVLVNNDTASGVVYLAVPRLDGTSITAPGWGAAFDAFPDANVGELSELAYTVPVQVGAGTHTVTQEVGPAIGTSDFFYNHNTLSVQFFPTGSASFSAASFSPQSESGEDRFGR